MVKGDCDLGLRGPGLSTTLEKGQESLKIDNGQGPEAKSRIPTLKSSVRGD